MVFASTALDFVLALLAVAERPIRPDGIIKIAINLMAVDLNRFCISDSPFEVASLIVRCTK
jgi:hypothetical protein